MLSRNIENILQKQFCIVGFRLLSQVFPAANEVVEAVESNKRNWLRMNEKRQKMKYVGGTSMDIFDIELEEEKKPT